MGSQIRITKAFAAPRLVLARVVVGAQAEYAVGCTPLRVERIWRCDRSIKDLGYVLDHDPAPPVGQAPHGSGRVPDACPFSQSAGGNIRASTGQPGAREPPAKSHLVGQPRMRAQSWSAQVSHAEEAGPAATFAAALARVIRQPQRCHCLASPGMRRSDPWHGDGFCVAFLGLCKPVVPRKRQS